MTSKHEIRNRFLFNQFLEAILLDGNKLETRDDIKSVEQSIDGAVFVMEMRKFQVFVCREKLGGDWDVFDNRYSHQIAGKSVYSETEYVRDYLSSDYAGKYSEIVMKDCWLNEA